MALRGRQAGCGVGNLWVTGFFLLFQKVITQVVEKMYLHVLCAPVPEEFLDQNVVFFLRNTKGTFPVCA